MDAGGQRRSVNNIIGQHMAASTWGAFLKEKMQVDYAQSPRDGGKGLH